MEMDTEQDYIATNANNGQEYNKYLTSLHVSSLVPSCFFSSRTSFLKHHHVTRIHIDRQVIKLSSEKKGIFIHHLSIHPSMIQPAKAI
jgi:hypothetical protein